MCNLGLYKKVVEEASKVGGVEKYLELIEARGVKNAIKVGRVIPRNQAIGMCIFCLAVGATATYAWIHRQDIKVFFEEKCMVTS